MIAAAAYLCIGILLPRFFSRRMAETVPQPPKQVSGYLKRYRAMVSSANLGAILDNFD